jgi:predicted double-glycine peptidase
VRRSLACLACLASVGACTPRVAPGPRLPTNALPVPLVRQATDYSCGAAALLAVLYYWQVTDQKESDLYEALHMSPSDGTPPMRIAEVARSFQLDARIAENQRLDDLRAAIAAGESVIIDLEAWHEGSGPVDWSADWDDGHYVVLVGMDERYAYVMDPSAAAGYGYVPLDELDARWHDVETLPDGGSRRYVHTSIVVRGAKPLRSLPGPLIRME